MLLLEPNFLWLAAAVVLFWVGPWRAKRVGQGLLRSALWLCLVLALCQPALRSNDAPANRVVLLDRSASLSEDTAGAAEAALAQGIAPRDADAWTVLEWGRAEGQAPVATPNGPAQSLPAGSGLQSALTWGAAALPEQVPAGVLLVSDGLAADGFPTRALSELRARGIPVTWVQSPAVAGDVRPVGLRLASGLASSVRVGMPCSLIATVEGRGQTVSCRLLEVTDGAEPQELARVDDVPLNGAVQVPLLFEPEEAGFLSMELRVEVQEGNDPRPGNEVLTKTFAVQDPLRVAYLGGRMEEGAERLADLVGPGFAIESVEQPGSLGGMDLVVLDDRPANAMPEGIQEELVDAVTQGGLGLLAAGGEAAFGPGGYHNQPIETLLPVEMVQKEEKRDPSTSLVLIIDTSGSMGGNRVQLAKQVSRLAIRRLLPHDKVGIVEFYGAKRWAVPLQPASNSIEIERALNRLDAGGGTVILPAIEEAYYGLKNVRTRYKHVLILTDGGVETGAFEPLLRRMSDDGIAVSTVLVGPDAHSEFLVNIANWGQGRFYSVPNRFNLPEILLKQPASAKLPAYRPGLASVSVHGGRGWWGEVDPTDMPGIAGYVETRLRPGAERLIETQTERHPVLSSWRYGLGRVSALTTEPTGPGTEPWREWSDYGALLARVLLRTADDGAQPFAFALHREGREVRVVAERRGAPGLRPRVVTVANPDQPLAFQALSPERFEAQLFVDPSEEVRLLAGAADSQRSPLRLVLNGQDADRDELLVPSRQADELATMVAAQGGSVTDAWPEWNAMALSTASNPIGNRPLAPWLALLALLLYLLDLLLRRLPRQAS